MDKQAFFLKYLPINIVLKSMQNAVLPAYLGSTLRGAVGQALRNDPIAYNYLYNNRFLSSRRQDIVNPYMIVPPLINRTAYHEGEELNFQIFLFGEGIEYAQQLICILCNIHILRLGALRYPFKLMKIMHSLDQRVIWYDGLFHTIAIQSVVLPYRSLPDVKQLAVQIQTPLRIRRDGELLETLDFPTVIRNITNRVEAITARYGGWTDQAEITRIQKLSSEVSVIQNNLQHKHMERYSNRLGEKMDFSGLTGNIQFEGELTPFVPWLYAAQTLHIGRNTTFGMGKIDIEFI